MMQVSIRVGNYSVVSGQIKAKIARFEQRVGDAIQGAGIGTEAGAKQRAPVGTPESTGIKGYKGGRLRSSIKYKKVSRLSCRVGTNVTYARPVEFGHVTRSGSHVAPRPFLFPSYIENKQALMTELRSFLK